LFLAGVCREDLRGLHENANEVVYASFFAIPNVILKVELRRWV
jgi:hypothetical protein